MENIKPLNLLESILYIVGSDGIEINKIAGILGLKTKDVIQLIYEYSFYLEYNNKPFELSIFDKNIKLVTKREIYPYLVNLVEIEKNKALSYAALETLAIIAYNSNRVITKPEISKIRGIESDSVINNLITKNFVEYAGRNEELPGRPLIIKITNKFYDVFNIASYNDLPNLEKFQNANEKTENIFKSESSKNETLKDVLSKSEVSTKKSLNETNKEFEDIVNTNPFNESKSEQNDDEEWF